MKEVRSQFLRVSLNDIPLDQGNPDDSLIAVIYNSPADYTFNNFLYGLGTNNGGIYIESWGTFFTYERTPQESIYTLEDLFRHEFSKINSFSSYFVALPSGIARTAIFLCAPETVAINLILFIISPAEESVSTIDAVTVALPQKKRKTKKFQKFQTKKRRFYEKTNPNYLK